MNLTDYNQIRDLLTRHGFRFSKSLGQNFLTASWVPERIAESAGIDQSTAVLEIGPGIGCLTVELSRRAGKVLSVELDRSLMPVLAETLSGCDNTEVLFADVLKTDLTSVVQKEFAPLRPVVCANLPYNITSPVLTKLVTSELFDSITVMIQREVARRICAGPGESDYSTFARSSGIPNRRSSLTFLPDVSFRNRRLLPALSASHVVLTTRSRCTTSRECFLWCAQRSTSAAKHLSMHSLPVCPG